MTDKKQELNRYRAECRECDWSCGEKDSPIKHTEIHIRETGHNVSVEDLSGNPKNTDSDSKQLSIDKHHQSWVDKLEFDSTEWKIMKKQQEIISVLQDIINKFDD